MSNKNLRVLVAPKEVSGYYSRLCEGLRQLGVNYDFVTYVPHPRGYGGETLNPALLRLFRHLSNLAERPGSSALTRVYSWSAKLIQALWAFQAIIKYDAFIFGFGQSLLPSHLDLVILKKLGKPVISNLAHGSEARPPYIDGAWQSEEGEAPSIHQLAAQTEVTKRTVEMHEEYARILIGAPYSTSQFCKRRMINVFALGNPVALPGGDHDASPEDRSGGPVRILHAPSHPAAKGTALISQAVENLIRRGHRIEMIYLRRRPYGEVIAELQKCDFVIDQTFSDAPMAGLAAEAAWFGKPAVVGGYGLDRLAGHLPKDMWPPSRVCHPEEVEQAVEELIVDVEKRRQLGLAAQTFVRSQWDSVAVARNFMRLLTGDIPEDWWFDPRNVVYVEGFGQASSHTRQTIRDMVAAYGTGALGVAHRPDLEAAILDFAGLKHSAEAPLSQPA